MCWETLFVGAAARFKRVTGRRDKSREVGGEGVGRGGVCGDLTCLGCRLVESVMGSLRSPPWPRSLIMTSVWPPCWRQVLAGPLSGVSEVPIIGQSVSQK